MTKQVKNIALSLIVMLTATLQSPIANAAVDGATVVIVYNGASIRSTIVQTASIITNRSTGLSYIDLVFLDTNRQQQTLRLESSSQSRIEAFYSQLVTSVRKNSFQITAYASSQSGPWLYRATLEGSLVYFMLN